MTGQPIPNNRADESAERRSVIGPVIEKKVEDYPPELRQYWAGLKPPTGKYDGKAYKRPMPYFKESRVGRDKRS